MQIKTITCHEVYNHGASLQEYALLEFLNSNGFEAEAIHYKPRYLSGHFNLWAVSNPKFNVPIIKQLYLLAKLPGRLIALKKKKSFDDFHKKYIPVGNVLYRNNEELKQNLPESDVFICESDQIWNSFFENGKDPAFYLNFVPQEKKKISYGASFATDSIDDEIKGFVKRNVQNIHHISVRETSGLKILEDLGIQDVVQVLDPVFLLSAETWKQKFVDEMQGDFIFVYDFDSNSQIKEMALHKAKTKGWKIYTTNQNIKYADVNFWKEDPAFFLSLVYSAKLILTNSFHATAFSLIFNKQFVVVNRSEKINTRMRDLLSLFNLQNLMISTANEIDKLPKIEYSAINQKMEIEITKSKEFLFKSLSV